jgi:hypothetical protein
MVLGRILQMHAGRERVAVGRDRAIEQQSHAELLEVGGPASASQGQGVLTRDDRQLVRGEHALQLVGEAGREGLFLRA